MVIKNNIMDMIIGDGVPCKYTALSPNSIGYFSELGTSVDPLLTYPLNTTANGRFNFIMVGYDFLGRKKLIPDRSLQTYTSWDSLNEQGCIDGISINFKEKVTIKSASASSEWAVPMYGALKAIDGIVTGYDSGMWITASSVTGDQWLQLDLDSSQLIDEIRLFWYDSYMPITPIRIQILDNGTWTEIISKPITDTTGVTVHQMIIPITLSKPIQSYRIVSTGCFSVVEAQFFRNVPSTLKYEMRLINGGDTNTPTDENEWDKIIGQSSLNSTIIPGDDNIWHWNGHYTWTSNVDSSASYPTYRNTKGNSISAMLNNRFNSASKDNYISFRPILLVQTPVNKFLIKDNDQIKSTDGKIINYSNILPFNKDMFNQNGMNDLRNINNTVISSLSSQKYNIALYKTK